MTPLDFVPEGQYRPHYLALDPTWQTAYLSMANALLTMQSEVTLPLGFSLSDATWLISAIQRDVPEVLTIVAVASRGPRGEVPSAPVFKLTHRMSVSAAVDCLGTLSEQCEEVIASVRDLPRAKKVEKLHDWLCERASYDGEGRYYGIDHEIVGPLHFGMSRCEGISRAFKFLLDRAGVRSWVCYGWRGSPDEHKREPNHAWNIVDVGEGDEPRWSNVDVTQDLPRVGGMPKHVCFGMSDEDAPGWQKADEHVCYPSCASAGWHKEHHLQCAMPGGFRSIMARKTWQHEKTFEIKFGPGALWARDKDVFGYALNDAMEDCPPSVESVTVGRCPGLPSVLEIVPHYSS